MIRLYIDKAVSDLATNYADNLFSGRDASFAFPEENLLSLFNNYKSKRYKDVLSYIILEYPNILKANPDDLAKYAKYSKKYFQDLFIKKNGRKEEATEFSKGILKAMRYDAVRSLEGLEVFSSLGIKTCVYCNAQTTLVVERHRSKLSAKFELDHFYPKTIYPHLSTAFFNLIPSCSSCNKPKGNKVFKQDELFYLYKSDSNQLETCEFILDSASQTRYAASKNLKDITVTFKSYLKGKNATKLHNDLFCIQGIYDTQKDIVAELFHVHDAYENANKRSMLTDFKKLFPDELIFKSVMIGTYIGKEDIHKRPMSKFRQDIARQLKLI